MKEIVDNLKTFSLKNIDLARFVDWDYLTVKRPQSDFYFREVALISGLILIVISVLVIIFNSSLFKDCPPKQRIIKKISLLTIGNSLALIIYTMLRQEGVSFLSMRIFLVIIGLLYIVIFVYLVFYWVRCLPKRMKKFRKARIRDTYLHRKRH